MARPRKDQDSPQARQRLINAFWNLLETNRISDLTVGAISVKAGCNRGTFYYHFTDMNDLVFSAIESELLDNGNISNDIFNLVAGGDDELLERLIGNDRMSRLSLMMERGGFEMVESKVKSVLMSMWETILCPYGSSITLETRQIIEYASSGMLGLLTYRSRQLAKGEDAPFPGRFVTDAASFGLKQISVAQGIPEEEIISRLTMLNKFMNISN